MLPTKRHAAVWASASMLCLTACVTLPSKELAQSSKAGFHFFCIEDRRIAEPGVLAMACTFAATSDGTIPLQVASVGFDNQVAKVMSPAEIQAFAADRREKSAAPMSPGAVVLGSAAGGGQEGGLVGAALAGTFVAISHLQTGEKVTDPKYSEQHVLGAPFSLRMTAPVTKNLLVHFPSQDAVPQEATLCFSSPSQECLTVDIKLDAARYRARRG